MQPLEALAVISQAVDPRNAGKLTTGDYALIHQSLAVLGQALSAKTIGDEAASAIKPPEVKGKKKP